MVQFSAWINVCYRSLNCVNVCQSVMQHPLRLENSIKTTINMNSTKSGASRSSKNAPKPKTTPAMALRFSCTITQLSNAHMNHFLPKPVIACNNYRFALGDSPIKDVNRVAIRCGTATRKLARQLTSSQIKVLCFEISHTHGHTRSLRLSPKRPGAVTTDSKIFFKNSAARGI